MRSLSSNDPHICTSELFLQSQKFFLKVDISVTKKCCITGVLRVSCIYDFYIYAYKIYVVPPKQCCLHVKCSRLIQVSIRLILTSSFSFSFCFTTCSLSFLSWFINLSFFSFTENVKGMIQKKYCYFMLFIWFFFLFPVI